MLFSHYTPSSHSSIRIQNGTAQPIEIYYRGPTLLEFGWATLTPGEIRQVCIYRDESPPAGSEIVRIDVTRDERETAYQIRFDDLPKLGEFDGGIAYPVLVIHEVDYAFEYLPGLPP